MMPKWIVKDENFTPWVQGALTIGGAVIAFIGLKYDKSMWITMLGLLIAAVGGGVKPSTYAENQTLRQQLQEGTR